MTWFQYRDPLIEVLDYIVEVRLPGHDFSRLVYSNDLQKKCSLDETVAEDTIAIVHDDDLQFIEDVVSPCQKAGIEIPSQLLMHSRRTP